MSEIHVEITINCCKKGKMSLSAADASNNETGRISS